MNKRIGNLEFSPATYLLPKEEWPKHPAWHIDYWYPNAYYGRESEFEKDKDWYIDNRFGIKCRIHKDCFKSPECCMAIAAFEYNEHEECYEFEFVGDRPLNITKEEKEIFWDLIKYGFEQLNNKEK